MGPGARLLREELPDRFALSTAARLGATRAFAALAPGLMVACALAGCGSDDRGANPVLDLSVADELGQDLSVQYLTSEDLSASLMDDLAGDLWMPPNVDLLDPDLGCAVVLPSRTLHEVWCNASMPSAMFCFSESQPPGGF